jgi:hypothetical protein
MPMRVSESLGRPLSRPGKRMGSFAPVFGLTRSAYLLRCTLPPVMVSIRHRTGAVE